ncbi:hypothetical protein A2574_00795 [Candidatus Shapirobacteria bacterium RIFOXYD1_FULL_38_32]|uniref:Uncharacterized protein n=1 Tax=Candidatus Shapirobacteria bacterium GW2011_GWE2_38_30 TaxID=1618490 RepID=A0A0G0K1P2_9BACT|nr:MAG: hypothetical protein US90_C0017G0009 [Candidatus Shapirobacteria bacterium GW2011_GWE2_38_30]OGL56380.1 MAG: hypothetical protein A2195_03275 [Candidatus Shapirobacteria bacterium RIFOXYA1_FULL_39_17]OGL56609.1 MAG: hypothetical protein A2410_01060 [Candidatus Shapirobacteria bacterium RIFOXYC1_FULL_38_24]OGL57999.1 MAG: hypothetical protein A2574_00795 [Candidatus Shapirobacteria bacterium RIFOXYD1_FULL_38_32]HAP37909.1 hypothetical protein [Candidatus Shapirobacteria bacterium]
MEKRGVEKFVDRRGTYRVIKPDGTSEMGVDPETLEMSELTRKLSVAEVDKLRKLGYKLENKDPRVDTGPGSND